MNTPKDLSLITNLLDKTPKEISSQLSNMDIRLIIDKVKELRDLQKKAKKVEGIVTQIMYGKLPWGVPTESNYSKYSDFVLEGTNTSATLKHVVQARFNLTAFAAAYPEKYKQFLGNSEFMQIKFNKED